MVTKCVKCNHPELIYLEIRRKDDGRLYDERKCPNCGAHYIVRYNYAGKTPLIYPKIKNFRDKNLENFTHRKVWYQLKRDGSNIGIYLDANDEIGVRSREYDVAVEQLKNYILECPGIYEIKQYLYDNPSAIIFGELMVKGKSPARFEMHEKTHFQAFDIHDGYKWLSPLEVVSKCDHYNIPIVPMLGSEYITDEKKLISGINLRFDMFPSYEGIIVKNGEGDLFKFKRDDPKYTTEKEKRNSDKLFLPDIEITSTIRKILLDLPEKDREIVKIAMPLIGIAIGKECRESGTKAPRDLFRYYQEELKEIGG